MPRVGLLVRNKPLQPFVFAAWHCDQTKAFGAPRIMSGYSNTLRAAAAARAAAKSRGRKAVKRQARALGLKFPNVYELRRRARGGRFAL